MQAAGKKQIGKKLITSRIYCLGVNGNGVRDYSGGPFIVRFHADGFTPDPPTGTEPADDTGTDKMFPKMCRERLFAKFIISFQNCIFFTKLFNFKIKNAN